mmetsp:Transcript_9159/g.18731  ORF Transcript_9159/g.18731 Transcript_9159/m.18731 type:complete len:146 (-) Transcript_9159:640-1077(-)
MLAARTLATRSVAVRAAARVPQRRSAQTVPHLGTEKEMEKEALAQIKARIARQKQIESQTHKSEAEELDEMWKWVKLSLFVATPVCVLTLLKDMLFVEHDHRKPGPEPDYMRIRNKEFPWECSDCELFNSACWKKCRAEMAAEGN